MTPHDYDGIAFSTLFENVNLPDKISIGNFIIEVKKGINSTIQYNLKDFNLLGNEQGYTFQLPNGNLELSVQLYENENYHYRLFCYTKINGNQGMTFSINLTTEKESKNAIYLRQNINFKAKYPEMDKDEAKEYRKAKKVEFCSLLKKLGFNINGDIITFGVFNPVEKKLIDTTPDKFLNDFVIVSILKGHFQENKGYSLDLELIN